MTAAEPMTERFRAFSFVDRITSYEPGVRIGGRYTVPLGATRFPASLAAEAVGQLAAWAAMSQLEFTRRPVAGLATEVRFFGPILPGQTMDLEVALQSCDENAVAYSGGALVGGGRVLELRDCLGPMLPMEEFDAPEAVRADFQTLCGSGAPPDRFGGVPAPDVTVVDRTPGERLQAELRVPASAPYFDDHFPRRPVYPGTLLMDVQTELAVQLAREAGSLAACADRLVPTRVSNVKIRSFTPPGQTLSVRVELLSATAAGASLRAGASAGGKSVATAQIDVAPRSAS